MIDFGNINEGRALQLLLKNPEINSVETLKRKVACTYFPFFEIEYEAKQTNENSDKTRTWQSHDIWSQHNAAIESLIFVVNFFFIGQLGLELSIDSILWHDK